MTVQLGEPTMHELSESHTNAGQARLLRDYQIEAYEAVINDWGNGTRRVAVVLPTGVGKSSVLGKLISDCYHRGLRIAVMAHRAELLDQIVRDTLLVDPTIPREHFGLVRAENDDHTAPIVVAMFQTLANPKRALALGQRDVLLVDETHHIVAEGYHKTFVTLGGYDGAFFCGFTATLYRAEVTKGRSGAIGLGDVIEKVSYEKDLRWAIENGWLVPPTGLTVRIEALNALNKIKNVAGDFNQGDLAEVMEAAVEYTVDAVEMHARDRKSIIFAASVEASKMIADLINERGKLRAAATIGSMGYEERKPVYDAFRKGDLDIMVTVGVLTEGADFPMCDAVVMARPTRSRILYSQMVGRALRLYEDPEGKVKTDALVLDLSGSVREMKLIHLSELVHGIGIEVSEVDEDGEIIEPELCAMTGENVLTCMCPDCIEFRTPEKRIRNTRQGVVDMVTIDLLDGNDTLWLETPARVMFIPIDDKSDPGWIVFLWPNEDMSGWAVGTKNTRSGKGGWIDGDEPVYYPMATAIKEAEGWVLRQKGKTLPSKFASWRRRNQAPSELQAGLARRLGIPEFEGMTKGRLSDEISIALAAEVLDEAARLNAEDQ